MNNTGKKFGGRKKGTPNKNSAFLNTFIQYVIDGGGEKLKKELDKLEGKEFVEVFIKLLKSVSTVSKRDKTKANEYIIELINNKINK